MASIRGDYSNEFGAECTTLLTEQRRSVSESAYSIVLQHLRNNGYLLVVSTICLAVPTFTDNCVHAQLQQAQTSTRDVYSDNFGDRLPTHCICRLGTIRLKENEEVQSVTFSAD